ncbi:glycosyltransferase family 2 protein [Allorhizobium pseudoryzae]|uniref:glycosyltransferase family 2 protein n=1 Tax=Allorhizobium pseudoryzae TaxID=379684 RepID=UPI003CFECB6D
MVDISVLIPLYNHAHYIGEAIESVLGQSSQADEIIIIDDGSQDDGLAVAEKMLGNVANARIFRQPNQGAHVTINRLVRTSRSQYLAVLNSDDQFLPGKLGRCREILSQHQEVDLICGGVAIMDGDSKKVDRGETIDWLARGSAFLNESQLPQLALMNENFVTTTSNMVFSRRLWDQSGGFQNLRYCHDFDFLMSAYARGVVVLDLKQDHIRYRVHPTNTIKEKIEMVRLEIASVIAASLGEVGAGILANEINAHTLDMFYRMLDNKGMSKLIVLLQAIYAQVGNRPDFYDMIAKHEYASVLRKAIA